jgi:hypothetical protein
MNAVNINKVLYIFTGTYPIYAKVVEEELKFYLFPITAPTFDEIVVTGHNLLEDDYEGLYGFTGDNYALEPEDVVVDNNLEVLDFETAKTNFFPKFPFVSQNDVNGSLNLHYSYKYNEDINNLNSTNALILDELSFAVSGPGSSILDFIPVSKESITVNQINNVTPGTDVLVVTDDLLKISATQATFFDVNYPRIPQGTDEVFYTKEIKQITETSPVVRNSLYNVNHRINAL